MTDSPRFPKIICWLTALAAVGAPTAAARAERAIVQLHASGGEHVLWLVTGIREPGGQTLLQWFSYLDKPDDPPRAAPVSPQLGRIARVATVQDTIHVFFADGVHYSYSKSGDRRELRLPESAVPAAIAGTPTGRPPLLWALVTSHTAGRVEAEWLEQQRRQASKPATRELGRSSPASSLPVIEEPKRTTQSLGGYSLVRYDGLGWRPGFDAAPEFTTAARVWLCAHENRQILLWQVDAKSDEILSSWRIDDQWRANETLRLPEAPTAAFAMSSGNDLLFAAIIRERINAGGLRCWVWRMSPPNTGMRGEWLAVSSPVLDDGKPLEMDAGAAVAAFGDYLAVVRPAGNKAEAGLWSLKDGKPAKPFVDVPTRQGEPKPPSSYRNLADVIIIGVLMAVVLVIFRRRHEHTIAPAMLPAEVVVANLGKRVVAALIDMLPAMILVGWLWRTPIADFWDDLSTIGLLGRFPNDIPVPHALFWAGLAFRLIYAAYCLVFELFWSATPGKRLMGFSVVTESLDRPSRLQVLARNLTRPLELEPAMIFFLAIVFFTPYRQRIGDLLARTVVIEGTPPAKTNSQELQDDADQ
ncbi:MAG TPA: RDD family protein [Phycisphaerae bacterium]|nr:RDD family protein [Phycisphaerae bacterium]HRR87119.1 RDD family protein [Phycisphaerae bacterium]